MSRNCFTYLIGWKTHNLWYYGVRYAKNCQPESLWTTYFTSSKHVKNCRELYGEPDIVEVRKVFGNNVTKAREWENKVLTRLNVFKDPKWLNMTKNNSFRGSDKTSWNVGLTKETSPHLKLIAEKIKITHKLNKHRYKKTRRKRTEEEIKKNIWHQIKTHSPDLKYQTYDDLVKDVINLSGEYSPWQISKIIKISEGAVKTIFSKNNISYIKNNQRFTKLNSRHPNRWKNLEDFESEVVYLVNKNYCIEEISKILDVNRDTIKTTLRKKDIIPYRGKTGPKTNH